MAMDKEKALVRAQRLIVEAIDNQEKHGTVLTTTVNRLRQYAAEANIGKHADTSAKVFEKGIWTIGFVESNGHRRYFLESSDFHHDAGLAVSGDFATNEDREAYANELARRLNLAASVMAAAQEHPDRYAEDQ